MRRPALASLGFFGLAVAACIDDVDRISVVKDLRVLAIRAEPPEVLVDDYLASAFSETLGTPIPPPAPWPTVSFEALAVDPRGTGLHFRWQFCPLQVNDACLTFADDVQRASQDVQAGLRAWWETPSPERVLEGDVDSLGPLEPLPPAPYNVTLDGPLLRHHALDQFFFGFLGGSWPSAVLTVSGNGEELISEKRLVLNLRDPARLFELIRQLAPPDVQAGIGGIEERIGFTLCPPAGSTTPAPEGCLALQPRTPNQNPLIDHLEVAAGESALTPLVPVEPGSQPLQLGVGNALRIGPVLADGSVETYEILKTELQSGQVFVETREEDLSVAFFVTAGRVQEEITTKLTTRNLDTVYTAPDAPPAETNGMVRVYVVVRDGRGGVDWAWVDLEILAKP